MHNTKPASACYYGEGAGEQEAEQPAEDPAEEAGSA